MKKKLQQITANKVRQKKIETIFKHLSEVEAAIYQRYLKYVSACKCLLLTSVYTVFFNLFLYFIHSRVGTLTTS